MGQDQAEEDRVDRLLDGIRRDWRQLSAVEGEDARQLIRRRMHRSFDELRRRLEGGED